MKISYNNVKRGMFVRFAGVLYEILDTEFIRMQQRKPVMRIKVRDLSNNKVRDIALQPSDEVDEVDLNKIEAKFIYENKGEYCFAEKNNPSNRFFFKKEQLGDKSEYLKPEMDVLAVMDDESILDISLPIKVDLLVVEAPPAIKGNTSSGGNKVVVVETGAKITTPLFINKGDIIRINTQTGEYSERVEKNIS